MIDDFIEKLIEGRQHEHAVTFLLQKEMAFWPRKKFTSFHVRPSDFGLFKGMTLPPSLPPFDFECADEFERWMKDHPAPDFQELIRKHGSYSQIPPDAWAEFDTAMKEWDELRKTRTI